LVGNRVGTDWIGSILWIANSGNGVKAEKTVELSLSFLAQQVLGRLELRAMSHIE
jgi:hypothetical protein